MIRNTKTARGLVSRAAMGAALALGLVAGGTMMASPAMAAKEPKAPKQAPLKLSPGFQKLAGPLQNALNAAKSRANVTAAGTNAQALSAALQPEKTMLDEAQAAVANEDDRMVYGQFAVTLGGLAQDPALQRKGIDAMLQSGKMPASEQPKLKFYLGQLAYQAKDYAAARTALQEAVTGGYNENDVQILLAETYLVDPAQQAQGLTMLQRAIDAKKASGQPVPGSWYRRGLGAAYKAQATDKAVDFAVGLVQSEPTQQNWGASITIIREIGKYPPQDMLDLLRLMGRTNSYAEARDYLEYVEAADPRRLPGEALKVLDAGKAAGKLSDSDRTIADARAIANERIGPDKASLPGLERDARAANASAVTALAGGDAFLSYGDAAKAEQLYTIALTKSGVDQARALTRLGITQVDQGKYAEAQATFAKVTGPRKPVADLWSAYAAGKAKPAA